MELVTCTCGSDKADGFHREYHEVTPAGETLKSGKKMEMRKCTSCGTVRKYEAVEDYRGFYAKYPPTTKKYKAKGLAHDMNVARQRAAQYSITRGTGERILDVGSGSGAFVSVCRSMGAEAYGCELAEYADRADQEFVYPNAFEEIHFPVDHFDKVTLHDVLEHVVDPNAFLAECHRVTKMGGYLIVDLPKFHSVHGRHHWKPYHLWYWTPEQATKLIERHGFKVVEVRTPVPSKVTLFCYKEPLQRQKVLFPPGIGDSYWSVVKAQSFARQRGIGTPDIYFAHPKPRTYMADKRSCSFIEMYPFLHNSGQSILTDGTDRKLWLEAYAEMGRTVFQDPLPGVDWMLSYNGYLRYGHQLENVDPELICDWQPRRFVSLEERYFKAQCQRDWGKYIVFYFVFHGTYVHWLKDFKLPYVAEYISKVCGEEFTPVLAGAVWDLEEKHLKNLRGMLPKNTVNMIGRTNLAQAFGMMRGAEMVVGYPSGLTIMGAVLDVKTLIVWNRYYNQDFAWFCVPPNVRGRTYDIAFTQGLTPTALLKKSSTLLEGKCEPPELAPRGEGTLIHEVTKKSTTHQKSPVKTTIACVLRSGGDFTPDYVKRLRNMVERNATVKFDFVCLTDMEMDFCRTISIHGSAPGWWAKVQLFKPDTFYTERVLYFDLDTVIVGNIDQLIEYQGRLAALQPWNPSNRRSGMLASGLMMFEADGYPEIWHEFNPKNIQAFPRGDQEYISLKLREKGKAWTPVQELMAGVYSFKRNCRRNLPDDARVVMFHGNPRPGAANAAWVKSHWR